MRSKFVFIILLYASIGLTPRARAQADLAIEHRPNDCFPTDRFPVIRADIEAASEIESARVYFHSDKYPDLYYVEMSPTENGYEAILPMPGAETRRIIYYIEAVDGAFNSNRTEAHEPSVDDECREDPTAVFLGDNPGIIIGALQAGVPAIPAGFQAAGIAGLAAAAGGGIGATTAVVVAAGAAGAAGAAVVATGGEDTTTTTTSATVTSTTSVTGTTTSISGATTTTTGPTTSVGPTTTTISPTTTSTESTTTTSIPDPEACFETMHLNHCRMKFDAKCSTGGEIIAYWWEIDTEGVVGGPITQITPAEVYNHDFVTCSGQVIQVQLTITDIEGRSDTVTLPVTLPTMLRAHPHWLDGIPASVASRLDVQPPDDTARGFIVFNEARRDETNSSKEFRHVFVGREGKNEIEARLANGLQGTALWRFDFSGVESFVPGSIEVVQGQPVSRGGYEVIFRLQGLPGEAVRFTYGLKMEMVRLRSQP